ncbi:hypothetical protein [Desulfosporosinus sp. FKA]|uniref:hypothetical protein n=1 Tax=Desulfosporosinus sp. FKA TaxID=1969834 RepID=UPI001FA83B30|nr:hypothetical protein [Desulfosporosinus sp. FKA]
MKYSNFDLRIEEFMLYCTAEEGNNNPFVRRDRGKPICVNTINNYVRNIKLFFNWLTDEDE